MVIGSKEIRTVRDRENAYANWFIFLQRKMRKSDL